MGHLIGYSVFRNITAIKQKGMEQMKGYHTEKGYMGYVNGVYMLFASETDYYEFLDEQS